MGENFPDATAAEGAKRRAEIMDIVAAVVLATAGLLTAWAGYQASRWDGEEMAHYTRADELRVDSAQVSARAGQLQIVDVLLFDDWLRSTAAGDKTLAEFYRRRFRPAFVPAFEAWEAARARSPDRAPATPFSDPAYHRAGLDEARALDRQARAEFAAGRKAKNTGDQFVLATVLLANALFFGGISQVTKRHWVRAVMLAVAAFSCLLGVVAIARLPHVWS